MSIWRQLLGLERDGGHSSDAAVAQHSARPRAASGGSTEITITTPAELEEALRSGNVAASGQAVTAETALRIGAVFACLRLRSAAVANMPIGIKRRIDERTRTDAIGHPLREVLTRKPNAWQTPRMFKQMMEANVLLRGRAEAVKVKGVGGRVIGLIPLHPDRVERRQRDDLELEFIWTRKDGRRILFRQADIFALTGLSLDGVNGLSLLAYAREAVGESLAMQHHGGTVFRSGANVSGAFKLPAGKSLTQDQADSLRAQLDEFRQGGAKDGKAIVLEDGLEYQQMGLSAEDAQWIEARKFSRGDIAMFFGVPPHMIGDTDKSTSWGTGIEAQSQGFVTYTLEDSLVMWEETIALHCLDPQRDPDIYARFNRNSLVRGDLRSRWEAYVKAMQWGVFSPNKVLEMEDENPRPGGDIYYDPPNTAGDRNSSGDANVNS